jgi:hypothetical protein
VPQPNGWSRSICRIVGDKVCTVEHFSHAYAQIYPTPIGYSPFTMPNYRDGFQQYKLMEVLKRTR